MFSYINSIIDVYSNFKKEPCFFIISNKYDLDNEMLDMLLTLKNENRYLKIFLEIQNNDIHYLKKTIKTAIKYYCDGFVINDKPDFVLLKKFKIILQKLPYPYDFDWDIYIKNEKGMLLYKNDTFISKYIITQNCINYTFIQKKTSNIQKNVNIQKKTSNIQKNVNISRINESPNYTIDINVHYF